MRAVLVLTTFASLGAGQSGAAQGLPDDDAVRAAWKRLTSEERIEAAEFFRFECDQLSLTKLELLRKTLALAGEDPESWPAWSEPDFYSPEVHAPGLPIPRKRLGPKSKTLATQLERFLPKPHARELLSAYRYDWGTGRIHRSGDPWDPDALFENLMRGHAPSTDLANALLLRALDDGKQRKTLAAFGHAYTDREGNVFTGITLYDAWRSGRLIEMPDIDALGIVHDVLDEWDRWVSPVPASQQTPLYDLVGELFAPARSHKELRETLAGLFLGANPAPVGTYAGLHTSLHALWVRAGSDPNRMLELLPEEAKRTAAWIKRTAKIAADDPETFDAGLQRQAELANDEERLRRTMSEVLRKMGAFDERPKGEKSARER